MYRLTLNESRSRAVLTQISGPNHHFSAYYEDNTLLIQFIMVEFVQIYEAISQIKNLLQNHLDCNQSDSPLFPPLIQVLGQLIGTLHQQERSSFSSWSKGCLTKFKDYCEQFSRNSSHQNKQHVNLHMATHRVWLTALHILELLNSLHSHSQFRKANTIIPLHTLKRSFHTLQLRFNRVIRYIPRIMNLYGNNENVILCLLRKKALFSAIYGSNFLNKQFKWPVKSQGLTQLLLQRYQARGFEALLPIIQQIDVEEEPNDNT